MAIDVAKEVAALKRLTAGALRDRYAEEFGEATTTGNKTWLVRRIAWRLQALAEGDISERAKARAAELARDADLRVIPPRETPERPVAERATVATGTVSRPAAVDDDRLPPPGSLITGANTARPALRGSWPTSRPAASTAWSCTRSIG
jgi:hypothetical protein